MSRVSTAQQTDVKRRTETGPFRLPDTTSTAEVILNEGLAFCAQKMGLDETKAVVKRLREGDGNACQYCRYGLAKKTAESIGRLDDNIKSVYVVDYDATAHDLCFGPASAASPIHLIVWAERKTDALASLLTALDSALLAKYAELFSASDMKRVLDVQVIDDQDVQNRIGHGALLTSTNNRPIQVWER